MREGAFVALLAARTAPLSGAGRTLDGPLTREGRPWSRPDPLPRPPSGGRDHRALDRGTRLRDLVRALADEEAMAPAVMPRTFKACCASIRSVASPGWQPLARNDFGGAATTWAGKTVELLAHVAIESRAAPTKPAPIVSPTSVSPNCVPRSPA